MYPELIALLDALCDLAIAATDDDPDLAAVRDRVTETRESLHRLTGQL